MAVRDGTALLRPTRRPRPRRPSPVRGHALPATGAMGLADPSGHRAAGEGTAVIFVGRTTTTGAANPSSPPALPRGIAAGTIRLDPSFAHGLSCPDCASERMTRILLTLTDGTPVDITCTSPQVRHGAGDGRPGRCWAPAAGRADQPSPARGWRLGAQRPMRALTRRRARPRSAGRQGCECVDRCQHTGRRRSRRPRGAAGRHRGRQPEDGPVVRRRSVVSRLRRGADDPHPAGADRRHAR